MIEVLRSHVVAAIAIVLAIGLVLGGLAGFAIAIAAGSPGPAAPSTEESPSPEQSGAPDPVPGSNAPDAAPTECPPADVEVATAGELEAALESATPGTVIRLASGRYLGQFVATASGTPDAPITLCGTEDSILDGGDWGDGYVFHLDGASHWRLIGFTVTNGQKGVMADGSVGSVIQGLTVHTIGDEAIHLRRASTDNLVAGNTIDNTGLRRPKFGEGIYVGTAESNWCDISDCQPDPSDRNVLEGNTITGTTSEAIDIKEGTTGGIVRGNTFDGSAIVEADSWVDVKGNDWLIEGNTGRNSPMDGFQTHEIVDGWGTGNVFRDNVAEVNGPGFGYSLTPVRDNVVTCGNTASDAGEGLSNVNCSG